MGILRRLWKRYIDDTPTIEELPPRDRRIVRIAIAIGLERLKEYRGRERENIETSIVEATRFVDLQDGITIHQKKGIDVMSDSPENTTPSPVPLQNLDTPESKAFWEYVERSIQEWKEQQPRWAKEMAERIAHERNIKKITTQRAAPGTLL